MRIKGCIQIVWFEIRLSNEYYMKMDFPQEKVFIACALVKNEVGEMRPFLQTSSQLCGFKTKL